MVRVLGNLLTRARPLDEVAACKRKCACGNKPVAIRKQQQAYLDHRQDAGDRRKSGDEERYQDGADGNGARRDGLMLDDLFGDCRQRRLCGPRAGAVASVAAVHDQVVEHHGRVVVGNVDFDAQPNGMVPVVDVAHRFRDVDCGIGPNSGAEIDKVGIVVQ